MTVDKTFQTAFRYYQEGNLQQAVEICLEILKIQPNNAIILHLLGAIFYQSQNYDRAISYFRQAVRFEPHFAEAYNNLGTALKVTGQLDEAISSFRKASELNPYYADAFYNLGNALVIKGLLDEAILSYKKALQINPNHAISYNNLANALREKGLLDEAIACYLKAVELAPNLADAFNNLGVAYQEKGQMDKALASYQKALLLNPTYADAYNNLGFTLQEKGQLNRAISCYKKALQLNPSLAAAHGHMALALLLRGDYEQGLKEYEWRWKTKYSCAREFSQPLWDGSDVKGLTILLHAEQGMGDTIQFIRFVPFVAERGARIIVECHKELTSLLKNIAGTGQIIAFGEQLPAFDLHCPLLSLPLLFGTTLETVPAKIPYIEANPVLVQKWANKVQSDNANKRIGLVWAGSPRYKENRNRSLSLNTFSSLSQIENITFYSLQKGEAAKQAENPPGGMHFIDLTKDINDFTDTAALIENLDLVISVDTAVTHLSGAMGKPVWTLIPFSPDWRWLLNREDSPWYPTMRLFRQPEIGDWESVIIKVTKELQAYASDKA